MKFLPIVLATASATNLRGGKPPPMAGANRRSDHHSTADEKVKLSVYSEAGCPNCQSLVAGDLNDVLTAEGVVEILDFDFVSFGNAYYLQSECPGFPEYDRQDGVACYQKKCSVDSPPSECFTGTIVCQHGADECAGNILQNCVKSLYPDPTTYMSFNTCYESSYPNGESCATGDMSWADIQSCVNDSDKVNGLMVAAAQETVKLLIPGTPSVYLNGESVNTRLLLKQVCKAYTGTPPVGCSSKVTETSTL
ncbi:hypothetical protein ScalyP_jg7637 [Parmales sp. scaly parma]|nr:hypothetical protein ScalyP_jg7637 [Parmales sp. scaly parma]